MATKKEIDAVSQLIKAAEEVNSSSDRVDVNVEMNRARVTVRISDPVAVLAAQPDGEWEWLFYEHDQAYFSDDVFSEDSFVERCQEYIKVINGFEGRVVQGESK